MSTQVAAPAPAVVQQIADPGPLGLAGFAMTTFVLSVFNTNMLNSSLDAAVLPLALFYGGLTQLLAGMWEFRKGNTFGAVAFSSFGAFWISFWALVSFAKDATPKAIGVYLLAWCIFTAYMTVASMKTNTVVLAVFVALTITFLFLAIGALGGNTSMTKVGGALGLLTAFLAWYGSFAAVTNATWKRTVLPVWPRG